MGLVLSSLTQSFHHHAVPTDAADPPDKDYFNDATQTYFGPHFAINNAQSTLPENNSKDDHFLDSKNILWSDIWSTIAGGKTVNQLQLKEFGNPYIHNPQTKEILPTSTLQALVDLKKNTIKLLNIGNDKFQLEFNFDASTDCLVRVYCGVKEVVVVDSKTGSAKGMRNVIFRSIDNSKPTSYTFGPFQSGLNQHFITPENNPLNSNYFYGSDPEVSSPTDDDGVVQSVQNSMQNINLNKNDNVSIDVECNNGESLHTPVNLDEEVVPMDNNVQEGKVKKIVPFLYSMVIVLETVVPQLSEGLEKASIQGMQNPVNSQSTFVSLTSSAKANTYDVKILKQKIMINSVSYLLQEIFGFLDDATENSGSQADDSLVSSTRDCVICMCEPRDTIVLPCRHLCLCKDCAEVLRSQGRQLPPEATVGGTAAAATDGESPANTTPAATPVPASNISTGVLGAILGTGAAATVLPSRTIQGPPKCPICRQVFHSLLQINLPKPHQAG